MKNFLIKLDIKFKRLRFHNQHKYEIFLIKFNMVGLEQLPTIAKHSNSTFIIIYKDLLTNLHFVDGIIKLFSSIQPMEHILNTLNGDLYSSKSIRMDK